MNNLFMLILYLLSFSFLNAQEKRKFYFELSINQDYRNNILTPFDSSKINDFRFRSSFLIGYSANIPSLNSNWDASYENRYQQYFKFLDYTRMEHLLNFHTSLVLNKKRLFYLNDNFRIRDYKNLRQNNYIRNILLFYLESKISSSLKLVVGYKNWIKNYPNIPNPKNYLSHRPFLKINYQLNRTTFLGAKTEFQWHRGILYPSTEYQIYSGDFSGSRYLFELFGNKIFFKNFLVDLTYRFEYDVTNELNYQSTGQNEGDEEPEDLLTEDPDYDYFKNQIAVSFLYKINTKFSFFSFIVLQNKNFNSWIVDNEGDKLRSDLFFYFSTMLKYKISSALRISLNFEHEKRNSNLNKMNYHRNTIGIGIQYNF